MSFDLTLKDGDQDPVIGQFAVTLTAPDFIL